MVNKYTDSELVIRRAKEDDMTAVAEMIQELADFEKMPDGPKLTVEDLKRDGFQSQPPAFHCLVAEREEDKTILGHALYFSTYSTWQGRSMMLEDLYVKSSERKSGIGGKLFDAVAKEAKKSGSLRLDFHVIEWNEAKSFYENRGAINLTKSEQWCYYRLFGDALNKVAEHAPDIV